MKKNNGFTLIELLVVISILGVLLALSVFGMQGARQSSRDGRRKADLEQIRSALEMYRADCNKYPGTGSVLADNPMVGTCSPFNTYLSKIPGDPQSPTRSYYYSSDGASTYQICASLEQGGTTINCGGSCGPSVSCNYRVTNP